MDKVNEPQKRRQLLLDEPPLIILPSLAVAVGLNEAIIVQQIHYWQAKKRAIVQAPKSDRIYNTIKDWQKQFPFFSTSLIRRALSNLEKYGIIISGNYNRNQADKTKSYSIDYDRLNEILESRLKNLGNQTEEEEKDTGADVAHDEEAYVESTETVPEAVSGAYVENEQFHCPKQPEDVSGCDSSNTQNEQRMCQDVTDPLPKMSSPLPKMSSPLPKMSSPLPKMSSSCITENTTESILENTTESTVESKDKNNARAHTHTRVLETNNQLSTSLVNNTENHTHTEDPSTEQDNYTTTTKPKTIPQTSPTPPLAVGADGKAAAVAASPTPPAGAKKKAASPNPAPMTPPGGPETVRKTLIDIYHDAIMEKHGIKPYINGGKDGRAVKEALKYASEESLTELIRDYVVTGRWEREGSPELSIILSARNVNKFNLARAKGGSSGVSRSQGNGQAVTAAAGTGTPAVDEWTVPYDDIISRLNRMTGSSYRPNDPATMKLIDARWEEGYRREDFYTVIDNMAVKWGKDPKMVAFLRPATLFSEKFGNYLGANITPADKGIVTQKGYSAIKGLSNWMEERDSKSDAVEAGDNMSQGTSGLNMGISAGCPERVIFV